MDLPQALAASNARSESPVSVWIYHVFPAEVQDLSNASSFPYGYGGVTIDARETDATMGTPDPSRVSYTNHIGSGNVTGLSYATPDNTDLTAPTSPGVFIGERDGTNDGEVRNFIRLFPSDMGANADGLHVFGMWAQPVITGENCSPTAGRFFLCSPIYDPIFIS